MVAREFLVLLSAPAAHPFRSHAQQPLHVTASIGIAAHNGHPDYAALCEAKGLGRNRVAASG